MKKAVFKYVPEMGQFGSFELELPLGARFLKVAMQHGLPTLWFEVSQDVPTHVRDFLIVGTGQPLPIPNEGHALNYLETFFDGAYVWHLYEVIKS